MMFGFTRFQIALMMLSLGCGIVTLVVTLLEN